jgi:KaiC/GvpD/RAD55 family RecA-like ATPase
MDKKKLEKELKGLKEEIVLLEVSSESVVEASLTILKYLTDNGQIGIIVSASRPYNSLFDLYKKHKINTKSLMIIDAISHKQGLKTEEVENVFFVENIKSLTTIAIMIKESLEKIKKQKFVFIDSVTTMLIYNNPEVYMRFLHSTLSEMRNQGVGGILIFIESEANEKIKMQLKTICDKVITLN